MCHCKQNSCCFIVGKTVHLAGVIGLNETYDSALDTDPNVAAMKSTEICTEVRFYHITELIFLSLNYLIYFPKNNYGSHVLFLLLTTLT